MKIHQHNAGHKTKMAAMPIYVKNHFKIFLSNNHLADFDETLYVASETEAVLFYNTSHKSGCHLRINSF